MKTFRIHALNLCIGIFMFSCLDSTNKMSNTDFVKGEKNLTASAILGNPKYLAMSYGGYRKKSRDSQPSIKEIKDDMKILSAMGIKIIRTYNVQLKQASNLLKLFQN